MDGSKNKKKTSMSETVNKNITLKFNTVPKSKYPKNKAVVLG